MILQLRKNHFRIWVLMLFVLIPLFMIGVVNVPEKAVSEFKRKLPPPYPEIIKEVDNNFFLISIRTNQQAQYQLEILVKNTIDVPAGVFHIIRENESISEKTYVGNLLSRGILRYPRLPHERHQQSP